ncbi:MAG: ATP-binding cassette domain-containing protein [Planctomycetota bacterium]|jgi:ABC-type polysaccharide/polyol phosphate transport system ATPase subunit/sugar lactone lactonase YvrE
MTTTDVVISASSVGKRYRLYRKPSDRLKEMLFAKRRFFEREVWSLRDVTFNVRRGEVVGIVGRNGAGKSTLLKVIAGIVAPTTGGIRRCGRTFSLLELGSGFDPEFTGLENIRANGAILGLTRRELAGIETRVVEFADIGDYVNQPVKTYSTGMHARLALSLALHLPAELLLIDEVISVGDVFFQIKCFDRMAELVKSGRTILLCSHDLGAVNRYCTRAICFCEGAIVMDGSPEEVLEAYLRSEGRMAANPAAAPSEEPPPARYTVPEVEILPMASEWLPDEDFQSTIRSARGLAIAENGNILVADMFSHGVFEVTPGGRLVAERTRKGFGHDGIYDPVGLELTADGALIAADYSRERVVVIEPGGRARQLMGRERTGPQAFLARFAPDGRAWVSSRGDRKVRVIDGDGVVAELKSIADRERYIADVAFRDGKAYLADFRNHRVLIVDSAGLDLKEVVSLEDLPNGRAPHGIAFKGGDLLITCHDSHSLVLLSRDHGRWVVRRTFDLRANLIEHPCYIVVRGDRAYVSASTLGGVVSLDISALRAPVRADEEDTGLAEPAVAAMGGSG